MNPLYNMMIADLAKRALAEETKAIQESSTSTKYKNIGGAFTFSKTGLAKDFIVDFFVNTNNVLKEWDRIRGISDVKTYDPNYTELNPLFKMGIKAILTFWFWIFLSSFNASGHTHNQNSIKFVDIELQHKKPDAPENRIKEKYAKIEQEEIKRGKINNEFISNIRKHNEFQKDTWKVLRPEKSYDKPLVMNDLTKSILAISKKFGIISDEPEDIAVQKTIRHLLAEEFNGEAEKVYKTLDKDARFIADYGEIGEFGSQPIPSSAPKFKSRTDKSISAEQFYLDNIFQYKPTRTILRKHDPTLDNQLRKECTEERLEQLAPSLHHTNNMIYNEAVAKYGDRVEVLRGAFLAKYHNKCNASRTTPSKKLQSKQSFAPAMN